MKTNLKVRFNKNSGSYNLLRDGEIVLTSPDINEIDTVRQKLKEAPPAVNQITIQQIDDFLHRPGINIAGLCKEAGITQQPLHHRLKTKKLPGRKMLEKLLLAMRKYGWEG